MDSIIIQKKKLKRIYLKNIDYKSNFQPCFKSPFSPNTIKCITGSDKNNSTENGALIRISPVGYFFNEKNY